MSSAGADAVGSSGAQEAADAEVRSILPQSTPGVSERSGGQHRVPRILPASLDYQSPPCALPMAPIRLAICSYNLTHLLQNTAQRRNEDAPAQPQFPPTEALASSIDAAFIAQQKAQV